jgi:TorA maturation chaperone TorD
MDDKQPQLLDDAAMTFAVLGMLLYQEPSEQRVVLLIGEDFFSGIPFSDDDPQIAEGLRLLETWTDNATQRDVTEVTAELNREWLRLLVGFGEPKAPPWAAYYFEKDPVIFGAKTLEVRRWYARYDLEIERKYREPDDHLGIMLQFLSHLISKESEASKANNAETTTHLRQEQKNFLAENLLPWIPHWQTLVTSESRNPFYAGLALLIAGTLQTFVLRFR